MLLVSVVLLLFAKKSAKKSEKKDVKSLNILTFWLNKCGLQDELAHSLYIFLTCDSCVVSGLGCRFGESPLPPDGRHFSGTLVCVGDAGAVLLVGPCAFFAVAQPVVTLSVRGADSVLELCGLLIDSSSAVCGYFLPLKPARQRRFSLEVKVPAAAVLLSDLLQLQL